LVDKNKLLETELKRIFEGIETKPHPDGGANLIKTVEGEISGEAAEIEEGSVSEVGPDQKIVSLMITMTSDSDQLSMTSYIYPTWTGEIKRSIFNTPIAASLPSPADFPTPEAYRIAAQGSIARNIVDFQRALTRERELGLNDGAADDWANFMGALKLFEPKAKQGETS